MTPSIGIWPPFVMDLIQRIDFDALVEQTDLGAIIAASSSGAAADAIDEVRNHTVGLDEFIAGTAVIYSWDARAARLRFLSRG